MTSKAPTKSQDLNILNKEDKSTSPNPPNKGVSLKRDKYKWEELGPPGRFAHINKRDLNIDIRYQRDAISDSKILQIASAFSWPAFGAISVIHREDGTYWVFDGGHRTRASFYRDDVDELPCMVHEFSTLPEEAKAFLTTNVAKTNVSATDKYKAAVVNEEDVPVETHAILTRFGLTPYKAGSTQTTYIGCIQAIQKCVAVNAKDAEKVLGFCLRLEGANTVSGKLLSGMFYLHQHFKHRFDIIDRYGPRIAKFSQKSIEIKVKSFCDMCGKHSSLAFARGLLDQVVNFKLRKKVKWDESDFTAPDPDEVTSN